MMFILIALIPDHSGTHGTPRSRMGVVPADPTTSEPGGMFPDVSSPLPTPAGSSSPRRSELRGEAPIVESVKKHTELCATLGYISDEEKDRAVELFRERFGYEHPIRSLEASR